MRKTAIIITTLTIIAVPLFSGLLWARTIPYTAEVYIDKGKKARPELVMASPGKYPFVPLTEANKKIGYSPAAIWLKLKIENESALPEIMYADFGQPWTSVIDVYISGAGNSEEYHPGSSRPFSSRPVAYRGFVFPVQANPGMTVLYARIESPNRTLNLSVNLHPAEEFAKNEKLEIIALFLYYGILIAMALYNLFIFFSIRDRSYLYLMLFIVFFSLYNLVYDGIAYQYLWPEWPAWGNVSLNVFSKAYNIFILLFARSFLNTPVHLPRIDRGMIALVVVNGLFGILYMFSPDILPEYISISLILISIFFVLAIVLVLLRMGVRSARFFILAIILFLLSGLLSVFRGYGLLSANYLTMNGFQIGSVSMLLLLSLGLADRINFMMKENKKAEEKITRQYMEIQAQYEELESMNETILQTNNELRNTYDDLNMEKELLSATMLSIGDGVMVADKAGRVLLMNRAAERITGISARTGLVIDDLMTLKNETLRNPIPASALLFTPDGPFSGKTMSCVLITKDSEERNVLISSAHVSMRKGESSGTVIAITDITEQRRMEKEIIMSDKMESLTVLAGTIAHDINNMLTILGGAITLARICLPDDPRRAMEQLSIGEASIEKAGAIVRQLITFSREKELSKRPGDIGKTVSDAAMMTLGGTGVNLALALDDDLPQVQFDEVHMSQVVHNLLLNAVQAMPRGGTINVGIRNVVLEKDNPMVLPPGEYVLISIEDTGVGIPRDQIGKIFDPYFTTKEDGIGLGLASCYIIVKRHGGSIQVESEAGRGTCFNVYLSSAGK